MKLYIIAVVAAIFFSSCLKESIPDAMLHSKNGGGQGSSITATLSYKINGTAVNISVNDADNQNPNFLTLGCSKSNGYILDALSNIGEFSFTFYTDSLTVGDYNYNGSFGDMFITSNNGINEFVHAATDDMNFHITSYNKGHISGTFSGQLTPLISAGNPNDIYGTPGSVAITNGSFQNVPIFY